MSFAEEALSRAWDEAIRKHNGKLTVPEHPGDDPWVFTYPGGWLAHRDPSTLLYLVKKSLPGHRGKRA